MSSNKVTQHKKAVLEALSVTLGVVTEACKMAGVSRKQFYNWCNSDPEFKEAVASVENETLDFVESKLFQLIKGVSAVAPDGEVYTTLPCKTSIIFYLKTKGKKRGYIERSEITGANGGAIASELKITIVDSASGAGDANSTSGDKN